MSNDSDNNTFSIKNETKTYFNQTVSPDDDETDKYQIIIDRIQFSMTVIGFLGNVMVFITLSKNGRLFTSPSVLRLLKNQSVVDSLVCLVGSIFVLQPSNWTTSNETFSSFICQALLVYDIVTTWSFSEALTFIIKIHSKTSALSLKIQFWHGQWVYWSLVVASIYNLVVLAFERYLAICYPFKHKNFVGRNVTIAIVMTYVNGMIANCLCFVQVSFRNGECTNTYYLEGEAGINIFKGYAVYVLIDHFLFPALSFTFLYGRVIYTLSKRQTQEDKLGSSKIINEANKQLTRTCIVVTVIFILSLGYDINYYFLGRMGLVVYVKNDFLQKLGLFFSIFNSMANPIVYTALLPSYRRAMAATFCKFKKTETNELSSSSNTISSHA